MRFVTGPQSWVGSPRESKNFASARFSGLVVDRLVIGDTAALLAIGHRSGAEVLAASDVGQSLRREPRDAPLKFTGPAIDTIVSE